MLRCGVGLEMYCDEIVFQGGWWSFWSATCFEKIRILREGLPNEYRIIISTIGSLAYSIDSWVLVSRGYAPQELFECAPQELLE